MAVCLPKEMLSDVEKIINIDDSVERNQKLTELFGGDAKQAQEINLLYEKTLLLKNQEKALQRFIDGIDGTSVEKKAQLKTQIAERLANRTDKIENDELLAVVKDIYDRKYDLDIKPETIKAINKLKVESNGLKDIMQGTVDGSPERLAYGRKIVQISDIVNGVVNPQENFNILKTIQNVLKETGERFQGLSAPEKVVEAGRVVVDAATSAVYKSVQASMDASYALRQGFKILASNPTQWKNNMIESFKPFLKLTSKDAQQAVMNEFKARLVSNDLYQKAMDAKLGIGVIEEFFPTTMAEKIPVVGNILKASNEAFTIFSQGSRMGLFEDMVKNSLANGVEMTPQIYKDIATVANSITGRGSLGKYEAASQSINKLFFSGRFLSSQIDTFSMPFKKSLSPTARKFAMQSSVRTLGMLGSLMATASLFTDVEFDPRSSKFGKMKVPGSKDTWVDISGGLGSYITLTSRIATLSSKSATNNKIIKLNTDKYGARTAKDVVLDFLTNKLAPAPAIGNSFLKGKNFQGEKPTLTGEALNLAKPISAGNAYEIFNNEDTATALISTVFDLLGAGQTDYTKFK